MRRAVGAFWTRSTHYCGKHVLCGCASLFLGGLIGVLAAARLDQTSSLALGEQIDALISAAQDNAALHTQVWSVAWSVVRWILCVFVAGMTAASIVLIPTLLAVRGFFFTFAVGCVLRAVPTAAVQISFVLFGISALVTIPVLMLLCVQALEQTRTGERTRVKISFSPRMAIWALSSTIAAVLCEAYIIPAAFAELSKAIGP